MGKKLELIMLVLFSLICTCTTVSAADTTDLLNPYTVIDIFDFGDAGVEVMDYLTAVDGLACEAVTDEIFDKTIACSAEDLGNEKDYYTFYFTDDEALYMIRIDLVYIGGDLTIEQIYDSVGSNFNEIEMVPYSEGNFFDYIAEDSIAAACGIVNDWLYVCLNGVEETDESYPIVRIHYVQPEFVEAYDEG